AGVERRGHAVAPIGAAIEQRLEIDSLDETVVIDAGAHPHHDGMAPAMTLKDFLAREADLHRTPGEQRSFGDDDLVMEGVGLPAEAAAIRRGHDSNPVRCEIERTRERAMHVV